MPSDKQRYAKITMTITLLLSLLILAVSCKECPNEPEPVPGKVILSTAYVTTQAVYLEVSLSDSAKIADIRIERDSTVILGTTLRSVDTLIIDDSLQAGKTYSYRGYLLEKGKIQSSGDILPVTTLDTTSHAIAYWEIDTLGYRGEINDIWIISEDNIWAVGEFAVDDSTSQYTGHINYNAARWNGEKWTFYHLWNMGILDNDDGGATYIWALSPDHIYFVGGNGSIIHYNGFSFSKMTSGTTCDLDDIYGLDNNHIWAVGSETGEFQSVILFYDGKQWTTLHDTGYMGHGYWTKSVWTDSPYLLFLNGGSGRVLYDLVRNELHKDMTAGRWYGYAIDGLACNDIFATGMGSEVLHYNGSTWYLYPEIRDRFETYGHIKCVKMTPDLVIAGGFYYTGLYGLPIIIRGYR